MTLPWIAVVAVLAVALSYGRAWLLRRSTRIGVAADLLLVAAIVTWFYLPYLEPGLPPGDFGSDVMVGEAARELRPSFFSFPIWDPNLMCGRPTMDGPSPFRIFNLPFRGMEPIERMKHVTVLYHVLSGLAIYWLLHACGAADGALFAGVLYPVMTAKVARTAVHTQLLVPMFYAVLPLAFLALFRLRRGDRRGIVILALAFTALLLRDSQRAVLLAVLLGLLLGGYATVAAIARLTRGGSPLGSRWAALLVAVVAAFSLAVWIDAFDTINDFLGDPFRGGWGEGEQAFWIDRWSLDNLHSLFDRGNRLVGRYHGIAEGHFSPSVSRYVGISLCLLVLAGALAGPRFPLDRRRFWFVFLLFPLSVWLSFGNRPIAASMRTRWAAVLASSRVPAGEKAAIVAVAIVLAALAVAAAWRLLGPRRRRLPLAVLLVAMAAGLFLFVAPLPVLQRTVFFLRDFRNPDWFQVTVSSFAVCFPAALVVAACAIRFAARRWWPSALAALILIGLFDFLWYRQLLHRYQRSGDAIAEFRATFTTIGADPDRFRVLPGVSYKNLVDLGYVWHRKPLAWDYRSYTAPARTFDLINRVFDRIDGGDLALAARLAGLANVKYLADDNQQTEILASSPDLTLRLPGSRMSIYQNRAFRPWLQAYAKTACFVGRRGPVAVDLAGRMADFEIGLAHLDPDRGERFPACAMVLADEATERAGRAPKGAVIVPRDEVQVTERGSFRAAPVLDGSRPAPERIRVAARSEEAFFLVVSESFHPWWTASLDGEPAPLYPGEYAFLGVFVPPGLHTVELRFRRPWSFYALGWLSLTLVAGSIGYLGWTRHRTPAGERLFDG